jgi:beta-glucosidase/6-phospho-beta-glucosidase/beta-galactosidase
MSISFPQDFLWGASTSAHQVEGQNFNNDWWEWEQLIREQRMKAGLRATRKAGPKGELCTSDSLLTVTCHN